MSDEFRTYHWDEFIGQTKLKERLNIHIEAAVKQHRPLEHILLAGPPGFGKTSLASIISSRMNKNLYSYTMPLKDTAIKRLLQESNGIVLFDEIHRATPKEQEGLLSLLEFGYYQDKRGYRILPLSDDFSIIAATTEPHKVIPPLYDRFSIKPDFDQYLDEEMGAIVKQMASKANVEMDEETSISLGRATGGIPRVARQFVLAARDLHLVQGEIASSDKILSLCRTTPEGLTHKHLEYLRVLKKSNGLAGLKTLQTHLNVSESVVRDLERLLVNKGFVGFTESGRELTPSGYVRVTP